MRSTPGGIQQRVQEVGPDLQPLIPVNNESLFLRITLEPYGTPHPEILQFWRGVQVAYQLTRVVVGQKLLLLQLNQRLLDPFPGRLHFLVGSDLYRITIVVKVRHGYPFPVGAQFRVDLVSQGGELRILGRHGKKVPL